MNRYVVAYADKARSEIRRAIIIADTEQDARINFAAFCEVSPKQILYCYLSDDADELTHHSRCWAKFERGAS